MKGSGNTGKRGPGLLGRSAKVTEEMTAEPDLEGRASICLGEKEEGERCCTEAQRRGSQETMEPQKEHTPAPSRPPERKSEN